MKNPNIQTVLVTGGAGYVGSVLVPILLEAGYRVRVLDLFIYGDHVFDDVPQEDRERLEILKGDMRDQALLRKGLAGCDAVIHLACISNDPSFELDPALGRSINFDAFMPLVDIAKDSGVPPFHLCLVVERLRREGGPERHRGTAARAADRLLEIQGDVRR